MLVLKLNNFNDHINIGDDIRIYAMTARPSAAGGVIVSIDAPPHIPIVRSTAKNKERSAKKCLSGQKQAF